MTEYRWKKVLDYIELQQLSDDDEVKRLVRPIVAWMNTGSGCIFRVTAFLTLGGIDIPRQGLSIGVEGVGYYFFQTGRWLHADYVASKLLNNLYYNDAGAFADWLNIQLDVYDTPDEGQPKQQGKYFDRFIEEGDTYYRGCQEGESLIIKPMILKPTLNNG